ncbi:MAG: hypothetical protein HQL56_13555 [Magnetococcales bacterium]|nr:hypothetical protein [Magnetococcales bacterium]
MLFFTPERFTHSLPRFGIGLVILALLPWLFSGAVSAETARDHADAPSRNDQNDRSRWTWYGDQYRRQSPQESYRRPENGNRRDHRFRDYYDDRNSRPWGEVPADFDNRSSDYRDSYSPYRENPPPSRYSDYPRRENGQPPRYSDYPAREGWPSEPRYEDPSYRPPYGSYPSHPDDYGRTPYYGTSQPGYPSAREPRYDVPYPYRDSRGWDPGYGYPSQSPWQMPNMERQGYDDWWHPGDRASPP